MNDVSLQDVTHADAVNVLKGAGTRVEIVRIIIVIIL